MELLKKLVGISLGKIKSKFLDFMEESKLENAIEERLSGLFSKYIKNGQYLGYLDDIAENDILDDYIDFVKAYSKSKSVEDFFIEKKLDEKYNEEQQQIIISFLKEFGKEITDAIFEHSFSPYQKIYLGTLTKPQHMPELQTKVSPYNVEIVVKPETINKIKELLDTFNHVALYGIAGIGKSELAKCFAKFAIQEKIYDIVHWVNYENSLHQTILSLAGYIKHFSTRQYSFQDILNVLRNSDKHILLIIDNVKIQDQEFSLYQELMSISNCDILITSKSSSLYNFNAYNIPLLDDYDMIELYKKITKNLCTEIEQDLIKGIAREISYHTMAFIIICKQISCGQRSLKQILQELQKRIINKKEVKIIKDDTIRERQALELISDLFNLKDLSNVFQKILINSYYLPLEGMKRKLFARLSNNAVENINMLISNGYIQCNDDTISLHPIVNILIEREYQNKISNSELFFKNLMTHYSNKSNKVFYLMSIISKLNKVINLTTYEMANYIGTKSMSLGDYNNSLQFRLLQKDFVDKGSEDEKLFLRFETYNNLALAYKMLGDYDNADSLYKQCSELFENIPKSDYDKEIEIDFLVNIGAYYIDMSIFDKAFYYINLAYEEVSKDPTKYSNNMISNTYRNYAKAITRNPKSSMEERKRAINVLEELKEMGRGKKDPINKTDYATTLNNLAKRYVEDLKDYIGAEKLYDESIKILEENKNNLYGIVCYNSAQCQLLLYSQSKTKEQQNKIKYLINESLNVFGKGKITKNYLDTILLASSFYFDLGNKAIAKKYIEKASSILLKLKELSTEFDFSKYEQKLNELRDKSKK